MHTSETHKLLKEWYNEKEDMDTKLFDNSFSKSLFKQFSSDMRKGNIFQSLNIIPFSIVYFWFSWKKLDKNTARKIVREWADNKWCERVRYHGIKL